MVDHVNRSHDIRYHNVSHFIMNQRALFKVFDERFLTVNLEKRDKTVSVTRLQFDA